MDFSKQLADWTDSDGAAYQLGKALGIFGEHERFASLKWVFWSENPVGRALHEILLQLVAAGILEQDEDEDQFRWAGDVEGVLHAAHWGPSGGSDPNSPSATSTFADDPSMS
ncbi:hypothetical protein [Streptomyces sp. NPDC127092]|uniref:hypothetical protein n=1 Tax=Streptomyces sp. NPDC127092 TaxID=3347135 RepID=UPI003658CA84